MAAPALFLLRTHAQTATARPDMQLQRLLIRRDYRDQLGRPDAFVCATKNNPIEGLARLVIRAKQQKERFHAFLAVADASNLNDKQRLFCDLVT
jgi:hypothetical protein